jgi:hypothetical protein
MPTHKQISAKGGRSGIGAAKARKPGKARAAAAMRWGKWIACADALPEVGERVLAKYEGVYGPRVVTFWRDSVNLHFGEPPESQPATHWHPLPSA